MSYKFNVSSSETLCKKWTPQAVDCYLIGCNCSKCQLFRIFFSKKSYKCKMKETVIELVRKLGSPEAEKQ